MRDALLKTLALGGAVAALASYVRWRRASRPQTLHLVLIGFGAVHKALVRLIAREERRLLEEHNLVVKYRAIVARHGAWEAAPACSLSAETVASLADLVKPLCGRGPAGVRAHSSPDEATVRGIIARACKGRGLRCLCEAIDVDYEAGEPATTYLADALRLGCHAVSANKGPVVHHRERLLALAKQAGARYLHESAVMDGVPLFSLWRGGFAPGGAQLLSFRGCLNSTTGVVLQGMHDGKSMAQSLKLAQDAGIAEADPSGDLSGMDAAVKVVALAVALELHRCTRPDGTDAPPLRLADVQVSGIERVSPEQVSEVGGRGRKLRLVAGATAVDAADGARRIDAYVRVEELGPGDPLFALQGADAAVMLKTDRLAPVTIVQTGSVVEDTAFGTFADIVRACRPVPV